MFEEGDWHCDILVALAKVLLKPRYLEIGVRYGTSFNAVSPHCSFSMGVDPDDCSKYMNEGMFYHGTSDEFFAEENLGSYDLVFIDGLHEYEQVKKDFENAMNLDPKFICLHDTYPVDYETDHGCGDVYKILNDLGEHYFQLPHITIPRFPGVTIVQWLF